MKYKSVTPESKVTDTETVESSPTIVILVSQTTFPDEFTTTTRARSTVVSNPAISIVVSPAAERMLFVS